MGLEKERLERRERDKRADGEASGRAKAEKLRLLNATHERDVSKRAVGMRVLTVYSALQE